MNSERYKIAFTRDTYGSLFDCGFMDSYYDRPPNPHWIFNGPHNRIEVTDRVEIEEYMAGYEHNQLINLKNHTND